jgi:hypothetical protein
MGLYGMRFSVIPTAVAVFSCICYHDMDELK